MNEKRKTIKLILSNVKGYKADTALSIVFIVLEALSMTFSLISDAIDF